MQNRLGWIGTLGLVWCVSGAWLQSQDASPADTESVNVQAPELKPVFSDDFSKDSRGDYDIMGDVNWEKGKLTLGEGAIVRRIDGGAWAKVSLKLGELELAADGKPAELLIGFVLDGATNCAVRIRRHAPSADGVCGTVSLFDTANANGQLAAELVRELPINKDIPSSLDVEYRHGLVQVTSEERHLFATSIQHNVAQVVVYSSEAMHELTEMSISTIDPPAELTAEQNEELDEANSAVQEYMALDQEGNYSAAIPIAERVLDIKKRVLGVQHPDYATSLNNLAALYDAQADYARAEPLYKQALEIIRAALGEQHPSYATSLNTSLGSIKLRVTPRCGAALQTGTGDQKSGGGRTASRLCPKPG
ncbi:MAG: tetratricopeptide repeat protein [Pirellulaceae bacterium]